jgi:predicted nucleic acid-binding protein
VTSPGIPRANPGSPPLPPGRHDLRIGAGRPVVVLVDTNVVFQFSFRKPLAASAKAGDLVVYWSAAAEAELARVARREIAQAIERRLSVEESGARARAVAEALATLGADLDAQLAALREYFRPAPAVSLEETTTLTEIDDPDDRLHVLAARASGAAYLLTLDERHLPHGAIYAGVQCWHPDSFLTLFYQQNPDAYERAIQLIEELPDALALRLLP